MVNTGFIEAFSQIIREKRVDKGLLVDTIKTSLAMAARKKHGADADIRVHIDEAKGVVEIFRVYKVVEEVGSLINKECVGTKALAIVTHKSFRGDLIGRLFNYKPVVLRNTYSIRLGMYVYAHISSYTFYDLRSDAISVN